MVYIHIVLVLKFPQQGGVPLNIPRHLGVTTGLEEWENRRDFSHYGSGSHFCQRLPLSLCFLAFSSVKLYLLLDT